MNTINAFSFYKYKAVVTSIYDGDSITCDLDLGWGVCLKSRKIRLQGIDAPEIRGSEREHGLVSKARLEELILNKEVVLESYRDRTGKYGRYLATIWLFDDSGEESEWININQLLINEGLAEVYMK
jgi:micrococcal nuclease